MTDQSLKVTGSGSEACFRALNLESERLMPNYVVLLVTLREATQLTVATVAGYLKPLQ